MVEAADFNQPKSHAHDWRIKSPDGPTSPGTCTICGASRTFRNYIMDGDFIDKEQQRAQRALTTSKSNNYFDRMDRARKGWQI